MRGNIFLDFLINKDASTGKNVWRMASLPPQKKGCDGRQDQAGQGDEDNGSQ